MSQGAIVNPNRAIPRFRLNNVTPFTYRDGLTFLQILESLRDKINQLVANDDELIESYNSLVETLNETIERFYVEFDEHMEASTEVINGLVSQTIDAVNDAQALLADMEEISGLTGEDEAVAFLINDSSSQIRAALPPVIDEAVASLVGDGTSQIRAALPPVIDETVRGTVYDVSGPTGSVAGDTAAVVAASTAAEAAGRETVWLAPGHYQLDGVTAWDVHDRKLVGDGVTFSRGSFVYPWATSDLIPKTAPRGGRGTVAFELDDGRLDHWQDVFPVAKELGITMSTAVHTNSETGWYREAHRHGWQISSHLPGNTDARALSLAEFESMVAEAVDVIEAEIGGRENIGFVYPQHFRNADTDRIASRYHPYGRGVASSTAIYPRGQGHPWLTAAREIDTALLTPGLEPQLLSTLERVAASDGQIVLYWHYQRVNSAQKLQGLRDLVAYIRQLGMDIVNPDQIWGKKSLLEGEFDLDGLGALSGGASKVTAAGYRGGDCARLPSGGTIQVPDIAVTPKPGMFTAVRVGFRAKTAGFTNTISQGARVQCVEHQRTLESGTSGAGGVGSTNLTLPQLGNTEQTAIDWEATRGIIYLQPSTVNASFRISATGITGGDDPLIDDIDVQFVGHESSVQVETQLEGTPKNIYCPVPTLARCTVTVQPVGFQPAGQLTVRTHTASRIWVQSSDSADTGTVRITITPGPSYLDMTPPTSGA